MLEHNSIFTKIKNQLKQTKIDVKRRTKFLLLNEWEWGQLIKNQFSQLSWELKVLSPLDYSSEKILARSPSNLKENR